MITIAAVFCLALLIAAQFLIKNALVRTIIVVAFCAFFAGVGLNLGRDIGAAIERNAISDQVRDAFDILHKRTSTGDIKDIQKTILHMSEELPNAIVHGDASVVRFLNSNNFGNEQRNP